MLNKTFMYIIGLGNPGKKYSSTRHNIGWMVLDSLRENISCEQLTPKKHWQALVCECKSHTNTPTTLVYPQTYMNRSGETARAILRDHTNASLIIVHDDIALPVGTIKINQSRGDGGHNGVRSINQHIKQSDLVRVRVGVAGKRWWGDEPYIPTGPALPKHVLSGFSWWERSAVANGIHYAVEAIKAIDTDGIVAAMNHFNQRTKY